MDLNNNKIEQYKSPDGKIRCFGNKPGQILYANYHDNEWGEPEYNDNKLFEMLILEGAQAGLNWEIILKKRNGYREAFYDFDVQAISQMSNEELDLLLNNDQIIRNRLKIYSTRQNARIFLKIQKEFGSFSKYVWLFVNNTRIVNNYSKISDIPVTTDISDKLSKDLKKRGMSFVGSTIIYAYMQAIGMVNDHVAYCFKRAKQGKYDN